MNDLISKKAALALVATEKPQLLDSDALYMAIDDLPSAQPKWIPATERLPESNEFVESVRKYYLVQNEYGDMMVCCWDGKAWEQMYAHDYVEDAVVAWMPLPEPWKGEENE